LKEINHIKLLGLLKSKFCKPSDIIITKRGKPFVALISVKDLEFLERIKAGPPEDGLLGAVGMAPELEEVAEKTIVKLHERNWLNDLEFARLWIENRNAFRPRSARLLSYELRLKGVADDTIQQALEKFGGDENELAYQAGIKKAKQCRDETKLDFLKKVGGYLGRRGFHYGIVKPTVERLWKEYASTESEPLHNTEKME